MFESAIVAQLRHIYSALALKSKLCFYTRPSLVRRANAQICITQQNTDSMKKYRTRPRNQQRNKHTISPVSRPGWGGRVRGVVVPQSNWWGCAAQILKPVP